MSLGASLSQTIKDAAARHGLDPLLVAAVVVHESGGVPWKVRYEPGWRYFTKPDGSPCRAEDVRGMADCSDDTERALQAMGLGVMQVQGAVARELGFRGAFLSRLLDLETGLEYGCKKLAALCARYDTWDAVAAYNGGPGALQRVNDAGERVLPPHVAEYVTTTKGLYAGFQSGGLA